MKRILFLALATVLITASCESQLRLPYELTSFIENDVTVSIYLDGNANGEYFLSATFTPPDGYHLYSKDIPLTGVNGLGRPTLLELTEESQMKSLGKLTEGVSAEVPNFEPKELLVYPPGAVTLTLPVELPPGDEWVNDVLKVTTGHTRDGKVKPDGVDGSTFSTTNLGMYGLEEFLANLAYVRFSRSLPQRKSLLWKAARSKHAGA